MTAPWELVHAAVTVGLQALPVLPVLRGAMAPSVIFVALSTHSESCAVRLVRVTKVRQEPELALAPRGVPWMPMAHVVLAYQVTMALAAFLA